MGGKRNDGRLSIALVMLVMSACTPGQGPQTAATGISRPPPDDPTPTGIVYLCEGRKQVGVVYARNRASLTLDSKTWRLEYQATEGGGFRYFDAQHEWVGTDALAVLREIGQRAPLAFNCRATARA
jgi:hypothetical protein